MTLKEEIEREGIEVWEINTRTMKSGEPYVIYNLTNQGFNFILVCEPCKKYKLLTYDFQEIKKSNSLNKLLQKCKKLHIIEL